MPYPFLVVDNSRGGPSGVIEEALEFLKGRCGTVAPRPNTVEELAVIYDLGSKPRLRKPGCRTVDFGVPKKSFAKRHFKLAMLSETKYGGYTPQLSSGYIPHASCSQMGDTSRMDRDARKDILGRITTRRLELGIKSESALCEDAGLNRGYIKDLRSGATKHPTWNALKRLAAKLKCDPVWLVTGRPSTSDNPVVMEALTLLSGLSDERQRRIIETLRDLETAETRETEPSQPAKQAQS